jgi:hypothetical protein
MVISLRHSIVVRAWYFNQLQRQYQKRGWLLGGSGLDFALKRSTALLQRR